MWDWRDQVVLVTGGSGFFGRHLVSALRERQVAAVITPRSRQYDLRHEAAHEALYRDHPDITLVIHLAAIAGGIGANRAQPGVFYYDNILMSSYALEYARRAGVPKFVGIGTICSYPKFTPVPFREEDLWLGYPEETNAPYGLAKKMLLVQSQAYRAQYGYNAIHLMPTNLYGPGDNFDLETSHAIAAFIRRMSEARARDDDSITLWGDGSPTRDYVYVADAAEAVLLAAERYNDSEPVNIGSGQEISIRDLAETIAHLVGYTGHIEWDVSRPNGQPRRCLDVSQAQRSFGFRASTPFPAGLRTTIDWYEREFSRSLALAAEG